MNLIEKYEISNEEFKEVLGWEAKYTDYEIIICCVEKQISPKIIDVNGMQTWKTKIDIEVSLIPLPDGNLYYIKDYQNQFCKQYFKMNQKDFINDFSGLMKELTKED